jgi:prephenate dehydrogenase
MNKITIFGLGLLGGSIGLISQKNNLADQVIGLTRNNNNFDKIEALKLVKKLTSNLEDIKNSDLIILATPIGQFEDILKKIEPYIDQNTIITDVGSTKESVLKSAKKILGDKYTNFVGSHPIAGSEKHGPEAAFESLFDNKTVIVTPHESNKKETLLFINDFWQKIGCKVIEMNANDHDSIFSTVSHLPHALSFIFMNLINQKNNADDLLNYAASGFKDFTRIAGSSPEMWLDIFQNNKSFCIDNLQNFKELIDQFITSMESDQDLKEFISRASQTRKNWKK